MHTVTDAFKLSAKGCTASVVSNLRCPDTGIRVIGEPQVQPVLTLSLIVGSHDAMGSRH